MSGLGLTEPIEERHFRLTLEKFFARQGVYPNSVAVRQHQDYIAQELALSMIAEIWSDTIEEKTVNVTATVSVDVPATWWDHFKETHFPKWAKVRWPVKFRTETDTKSDAKTFKTVALFPGYEYKAPPGVGQVVIRLIESPLYGRYNG